MKKFINVPNTIFQLNIPGAPQSAVIGTLIAVDETGCTILVAADNSIHAYGPGIVYHATANI